MVLPVLRTSVNGPMTSHHPNPTPDLSALPGAKPLAGLSLLVLAAFVGQSLTSAVVLGLVAGFAVATTLAVASVALARGMARRGLPSWRTPDGRQQPSRVRSRTN